MCFFAQKRPDPINRKKQVVAPVESTTICNGEIDFSTPAATLYVCKGIISCRRNGHSVQSVTGVLRSRQGNVIKINVNYCPECRKCFISHDEYLHYKKLYKGLLGNIKIASGSFSLFEVDLAEESILSISGYSVNQTDNLSVLVRQSILQYLIDSKISNKAEIIDYLNFFIKRNGKKQNMDEAVRRWSEDLNWVREYQINSQRHFEISNFQRNK